MLLATHGRGIWVLDNLSPIQEYGAVQTSDAKLFPPPAVAMYRRPARDRNYEFWGDQTFFGENPPQAAVISWNLKRDVGDVKLKITEASGREVREIGAPVLASSNKAGVQSACWDLRVQPGPTATPRQGQGGAGGTGAQGGQGGQSTQTPSPFGAGCTIAGAGGAGGGGGGFGGAAQAAAGPFVLPGVYTVALIVDGKSVDTKPLRVTADPEVMLTELERKRMFDMAIELHELQRRATETANTLAPLNARMTELGKEVGAKSDVPADVKTSVESLSKDLAALANRLTPPAGGGFGGGAAAAAAARNNPVVRLGLAKTAMMAGMWPTEQSMRAYTDSKSEVPKVIADANALLAKASALSTTLTQHNLTLTVPAVKDMK
jgi:hypothetical protein